MHTFLAVADEEHVTSAADRLGHSQGSVSGQVRRLERILGVQLFHRVGRNVRLTDVGRGLRQLSVRALDVADQVEQLAAGYLAFEAGEVSLAAGPLLGAYRLWRWLAPFITAYPDIDFQIKLAPMQALLSMLSAGEADIVFVSADVRIAGVETLVLERTELVVVAGAQHPLAALRSPALELANHRHLAHEPGTATQIGARRVLGQIADGARTVELEEGALMAALLAGLGFTVMPRAVVEDDITAGRLVVLPMRGRRVPQLFAAASRATLRTPAAQALWEHLQALAESA